MSAIYRHTCLTAEDGKVWCWGDNTYGQLGDGTDSPGLQPVLVRGLPGPAKETHAGYGHTCAVLRSGDVYCWGNNQDGQCGVPPSEPIISKPVRVPAGVHFIAAVPGEGHTCGLTSDKLLYCWGNTELGQCGTHPDLTGLPTVGPTRVPGIDNVTSFALVKNHTCAVRSSEVLCWGSNSRVQPPDAPYVNGKLGPAAGDLEYSADPKPVAIGSPVLHVAMGAEATYALTQGGPIYAWGENDRLQLGIEEQEPIVRTPTPVKIETAAGLVPLAPVSVAFRTAGSDHCVGMANRTDFDAPYLCWGTDEWGELGAGTLEGARTTHRYPIAVRALPSTAFLAARGEDHACGAVVHAGRTEIRCYGRPGALGNGAAPAEDGDPPSQWEAAPVVWDPTNFASALE